MSHPIYTLKWYAVPNDLVGGWAVATRQAPMSDLGPYEEVADMVSTEAAARYIAELHNLNLATRKTRFA